MYVLTVELRIKPEHRNEFVAAITKQAEASVREEPGCHSFQVAYSETDPQLFLLYEAYADRRAFDLHREMSHSRESAALTRPWIEATTIKEWSSL